MLTCANQHALQRPTTEAGALDLETCIEVDDISSEDATTLVLAIHYDGIQAASRLRVIRRGVGPHLFEQ